MNKTRNIFFAMALLMASLCTFAQPSGNGHYTAISNVPTFIPKCDDLGTNFYEKVMYSTYTNTYSVTNVSTDYVTPYTPIGNVSNGACPYKWSIDADYISNSTDTLVNCRQISFAFAPDSLGNAPDGYIDIFYLQNGIHQSERYYAVSGILPSWNAADYFGLLEDVSFDAANCVGCYLNTIGCEITANFVIPPTILFSSVGKADFEASGLNFIEYEIFIDGVNTVLWTAGTGTLIGSTVTYSSDGGITQINVRNANGNIASDTWVRPDSDIDINEVKLNNDNDYSSVEVALTALAYDNLPESPSPTNSFVVTFDFYQNNSFQGTFNFPVTDIAQVETFTFDLTSIGIASGDFAVNANISDGIGTELVASTDAYTPCSADYILPLFNPVITAGGGGLDDFVVKQFSNISNIFSTNGSADIQNAEATCEAYNHTTLSTIYAQETVGIGSSASGTFTADFADETVYYYNATDICGKQVRLVGNDSHIIFRDAGELTVNGGAAPVNPASFASNPAQVGFKVELEGLTFGVYNVVRLGSQSGIRSEFPNFEDFATYEWTVTLTKSGVLTETQTSGVINGYDGIYEELVFSNDILTGDVLEYTLTITGTLGSTDTKTLTFTVL